MSAQSAPYPEFIGPLIKVAVIALSLEKSVIVQDSPDFKHHLFWRGKVTFSVRVQLEVTCGWFADYSHFGVPKCYSC